ncbi:MAG: family 78 glycoside hydrolase catalytic domain, partial [Clostridia bacterium]|nr:family 78 glycoside hydrolase catalytic domain [Clostridia bacterium]
LPGETALVDFGQNFAGREAFTVEGGAGTVLTVRHGEILNDNEGLRARGNDGPEGALYNANYRSAKALTRYILGGRGIEQYSPAFTFYGFRYAEFTADRPVVFHAVSGQVLTSVECEAGTMTTSDPAVNQLISNIRWGQYSNYLSIPTDCPQRDERQGWTADTQVFARAGCYLAFSKSFLGKFTADMRDSQNEEGAYPGTSPTGCYHGAGWGGTGWGDAGVILPHLLYRHYGDPTIITENWASMQKYVDGFLAGTDRFGPRKIWGDWLAYESNDAEIQEMLGVAFYAWDARMMAEMADVIGRTDDAARYRALYDAEKAFFMEKYVAEDGGLVRGEQSVCAYALYLDLLPDAASTATVRARLIDNITRNGNRLQTGFLGTAILMHVLTAIGRTDLAYSLLLQHENPSWLYSVDQGATTIWERWNSYTRRDGFGDVGMNSFNHYAYGSVAAWMFDTMAGIAPAAPGFKRIRLAPQPDRRLTCCASYDSAYGIIRAESDFIGDRLRYRCTLP